jgi:hypothetical protein
MVRSAGFFVRTPNYRQPRQFAPTRRVIRGECRHRRVGQLPREEFRNEFLRKIAWDADHAPWPMPVTARWMGWV